MTTTQPFRGEGTLYRSKIWPEIEIRHETDRIVIDSAMPLQMLSSAVIGGGFATARRVVNWKVPLHYDCSDPVKDMESMLDSWGYRLNETAGLLTAARLTHASVGEEEGDRFAALVCTTAGTSNAARAGIERPVFSAYTAGTINTVLLVDGKMTPAAMVNAVITATEAKSAALQDLGVVDPLHGAAATGTTTDTVVVAVSQSDRYGPCGRHTYAGSATTIGNAIGRLVYAAVSGAVSTQHISRFNG